MKKTLSLLNLILTLLVINAQEKSIYVEYDHGQWVKGFSNKEVLVAGKNIARYDVQELKSIPKKNKGSVDKSTNTIYVLPFNNIKPTTLYKTKSDNYMYFDIYMDEEDKQWFVTDKVPDQKWELIPNETKEIQGYICNKAKLNFRGSTFTAYYTLDIPTFFGPWKFNGLPGLILEITLDDNPKFYWRATKIIYPYKEISDFNFDEKQYKTTLQKFIIEEDNLREKKAKETMAKYAHLGPSSYSYKRVGPEKVYEWEKKNKINN